MAKLQIISPHANLHRAASKSSGLEMQVLHGTQVKLLEKKGRWRRVKTACGYVGFIEAKQASEKIKSKSHVVSIPNTFMYKSADIKSRVLGCLSMGAKVKVEKFIKNSGNNFAVVEGGEYIYASHLSEVSKSQKQNCIAICEMLLGVPYLWGGNTGLAVDCSGLIYLANLLNGKTVPRNSSQQQESELLGKKLPKKFLSCKSLKRGDYIFWPGHVGIMASKENLLHASGYHMQVVKEPIEKAIKRMKKSTGEPISISRP